MDIIPSKRQEKTKTFITLAGCKTNYVRTITGGGKHGHLLFAVLCLNHDVRIGTCSEIQKSNVDLKITILI